jgi:hypothetical protein
MAKTNKNATSSIDEQPILDEVLDTPEVEETETKEETSSIDEKASDSDSQENIVSTGEQSPAHEISSITVETSSNESATTYIDQHLVKIEISYPKDYKSHKFLSDGDVKEVSKEVADAFVQMGIAKIVK